MVPIRLKVPWVVGKPRLAVVLSGGGTLGAFEVGVIDVLASRGIVPDLLVGTSVGAINAAFWAMSPGPDTGRRLLQLWMRSDRSTMLPDGPLPMFRRLVQRFDHLTTQRGLKRDLERELPAAATIERASIPLVVIATDVTQGTRVAMRSGPLLPALLASAALPGLWPAVEIDGHRLVDGSVVSNCDLQAAAEAGMTDVIAVDVTGDSIPNGHLNVAQTVERALALATRRQTDLALAVFGRGMRVAVIRATPTVRPQLGDFSQTQTLFRDGRVATEEFAARHLAAGGRIRPGVFEMPVTAANTASALEAANMAPA